MNLQTGKEIGECTGYTDKKASICEYVKIVGQKNK